jgi:hypothetical protein
MAIIKAPGLLVALLASGLIVFSYSERSVAQSAQDQAAQNQSIQDRMRILQERIDDLAKQLEAVKRDQSNATAAAAAAATAPTSTSTPAAVAKAGGKASGGKEPGAESSFDKFIKGFYGTMDVSLDDTTKGIKGLKAFEWSYANPLDPTSPLVRGPQKGGPVGRVGWLGALSSNGSNIGYRGSHKIGHTDTDFIYQVSTAFDLVAAPGLNNSWTKSSNTVTGAIGLGDTFIGFRNKLWGTVKIGTMYTPYKTSTDRLNPFAGSWATTA